MVGGEVLQDLHRAVAHVSHANRGCRRLPVDEGAHVVELLCDGGAQRVVNEYEELEVRICTLKRLPSRDLVTILTLIHHNVFTIQHRNIIAVLRLGGDDHLHLHPGRGAALQRTDAQRDQQDSTNPDDGKEPLLHL